MFWRKRTAIAAICVTSRLFGAEENESPWDTSVSLRAGGGYKDNVLLSDFNKEASAFTQTDAEFFAYHLPENLWEFAGFLTVEDRRYWQSPSVDNESILLASLDLKRHIGEMWRPGLNFQYFYSDQVFDASIEEGFPFRVKSKLHRLSGGPLVLVNLPGKRRVEFGGVLTRQFFEEPLDDSWEFGPKLLLGQKFGRASDLVLTAAWRDRTYDTRVAPGTSADSLAFTQTEVDLGFRHVWDEAKHWSTRTRVGFEDNDDNGSGFYDYWRWRFSQEVGFTMGGFLANLQGKLLQYEYATQRGLDGSLRRRTEISVLARIEQEIVPRLKLFAEYEYEWVTATDITDRYQATTVSAGLEWEVK